MSFDFRAATADDAERLAELSLLAYPATDVDLAERVRRYRSGRPSPMETVTVIERDGVLVGSYRNIPYTGWLGGVPARVGGLASVAVAPEARLQGVAGAMIRRHLADLGGTRTPWSFLYPFAPRFYAHYGWGAAARRLRWRLRPESIPLLPERARVRRLRGEIAAMHALHERMLPRTNGALGRTASQLERSFSKTNAVCVGVDGPGGVLSAYLVYHLLAPTQRPQTLVVADWVGEDVASERALLGFLGAQRDQVSEIVLDTAEDHPLGALLENAAPAVEDDNLPSEHHGLATLASGLMARIVSLPDAVAARGYPGIVRGAVGLRVTADPVVPDNVTEVTARIEDGRAVAGTGSGSGDRPVITGPIGPMSAILVGALRVDGAARLGLVEVKGDLAAATAMLSLPPLAPGIAF